MTRFMIFPYEYSVDPEQFVKEKNHFFFLLYVNVPFVINQVTGQVAVYVWTFCSILSLFISVSRIHTLVITIALFSSVASSFTIQDHLRYSWPSVSPYKLWK